jgi:hypothetical protein
MTGRVWVKVHHDIGMAAPEEHQIFFVARFSHNPAEDTSSFFINAADVIKTPRSPESIHY